MFLKKDIQNNLFNFDENYQMIKYVVENKVSREKVIEFNEYEEKNFKKFVKELDVENYIIKVFDDKKLINELLITDIFDF